MVSFYSKGQYTGVRVSLSSSSNRVDIIPREKQTEHRIVCLTVADVYWKPLLQLIMVLKIKAKITYSRNTNRLPSIPGPEGTKQGVSPARAQVQA